MFCVILFVLHIQIEVNKMEPANWLLGEVLQLLQHDQVNHKPLHCCNFRLTSTLPTFLQVGPRSQRQATSQGKLGGCTVISHGVTLNYTTYYLSLGARRREGVAS